MAGAIAMRRAVAAPRRVMLRVRVPRDLAEVTDIDTTREVEPQEAGISPARAASLWRAVENLYRTGCYPAIMFCLRRHGRIVFNRALGHARGNGPDDEPDSTAAVRARWSTPGCVFSASKAPSAMVLHRMEQDGLIRLLDPVAHYIPEFGAHGKHRTTIYHLLAHRAGVPGIEGVTDPQVVLDHALSLQLICGAQPRHLLGRRQAYHAITAGVIVGEIVRRVTGMDIRQAWRRWFKEPMGFKVFDYGADARVRARIAEQTLTGLQGIGLVDRFAREILGATLPQIVDLVEGNSGFYRAIIPAGNMVTTADEIGAFYQMLLDGGSWGGKQILRPETVFRATHEAGPHSFDGTLGIPLRFSPGFMLGGAPFGLFGPRSQEAFGHIGLANNITWADPERRISVAMVVSGIPLIAGNLGALVRLMTAIAAACPREV